VHLKPDGRLQTAAEQSGSFPWSLGGHGTEAGCLRVSPSAAPLLGSSSSRPPACRGASAPATEGERGVRQGTGRFPPRLHNTEREWRSPVLGCRFQVVFPINRRQDGFRSVFLWIKPQLPGVGLRIAQYEGNHLRSGFQDFFSVFIYCNSTLQNKLVLCELWILDRLP